MAGKGERPVCALPAVSGPAPTPPAPVNPRPGGAVRRLHPACPAPLFPQKRSCIRSRGAPGVELDTRLRPDSPGRAPEHRGHTASPRRAVSDWAKRRPYTPAAPHYNARDPLPSCARLQNTLPTLTCAHAAPSRLRTCPPASPARDRSLTCAQRPAPSVLRSPGDPRNPTSRGPAPTLTCCGGRPTGGGPCAPSPFASCDWPQRLAPPPELNRTTVRATPRRRGPRLTAESLLGGCPPRRGAGGRAPWSEASPREARLLVNRVVVGRLLTPCPSFLFC